MKDMIKQNYRTIGIILAVLIAAGLTLAVIQTSSTDSSDPQEETSQKSGDMMLPETGNRTTVYFFWGDGCPYCAEEKPFLEELDQEHEDLEVKMYEVYNSKENQQLYQNVAEKYGVEARGVPATFIGQEHWAGYNEQIGNEIESKIEECLEKSCETPFE